MLFYRILIHTGQRKYKTIMRTTLLQHVPVMLLPLMYHLHQKISSNCTGQPIAAKKKLTNGQQKATCKKSNKKICRVCGQSSQISFWLGCSYRNPKTKRQECKYWVHQNCIGLYYKTEKDLERVSYYCKKHAPTYKKK